MTSNKNRTILIVNDALLKGGAERRMLELIKGLIKNDYKVILVLLSDIVEYDYVYQLPIEFIILRRRFKFEYRTFKRLQDIIKKNKPALIHSWGYVASVYLGPLAKMFKIKFINGIIVDAVQNLSIRHKTYWMGKVSFLFSDWILSNSYAGIKTFKPPLHKTMCIYNGLDLKRFEGLRNREDVLAELFGNELPENYKISGMVAAFEKRKDYDTLIEAAIRYCEKNANAYFLLIGGGSTWEDAKAKIPIKLLSRIIFTGKRNDVESIVNIFNVGILLSNSKVHGEGISNSIIEYMALSKPVIASRGGGTDEVVIDNENGYLIDSFAPDQLIAKLDLLFNDGDLAKQMGDKGRKMILEKFTLDKMTSAFINLYNSATENK